MLIGKKLKLMQKNSLQTTQNMITYENMTNKMDGVCERIKLYISGQTSLEQLRLARVFLALIALSRDKAQKCFTLWNRNVD